MKRNLDGPGLGTRLLLVIIPLLVGSILVSGVISGLYADAGIRRATNRLMVYKAEDFLRHADTQWSLLLENRLQDDAAYRENLRRSVRSYAATMLRSDGEWILAVDEAGRVRISVGDRLDDAAASEAAAAADFGPDGEAWIDGDFGGEARFGYGFNVPSLGWRVFITDRRDGYFGEIRNRRIDLAILIVVTTVLTAAIVIFFVGFSMKPLKTVVHDMTGIIETLDFHRRVDPVQNDEVGMLAREFNLMSDYLGRAIQRLKDTARMEAEARVAVRAREQETLDMLGRLSDFRDAETARHTTRVGHYASMLSRLRGDSDVEAELMRWAVPLHDIGKVGIPDAILLKEGILNARERRQMQVHVQIGHDILKDSASPVLRAGADIAISHHERWDGSGYPLGLRGEDILVRGRITALVDVFDALTTERPYKEPWPFEQAVVYVRNQRGREFDPGIADLFLANLDEVKRIFESYGDTDSGDARDSALS